MKQHPLAEDWAIVGGGLMGLTLALRLAEADHNVTVVEAEPRLGGLAVPQSFGGITWDKFYHVILSSDTHLRGLLASLGLAHRLRFTETRTGLHIGGRLRSVSSPWELLKCREIPLGAKVGLVRTVLASMLPATPTALDSESAISWLMRNSGEAAVDLIWRPLLRAKLGDAAESASALFIWTTLRRLYGLGAGQTGSGQFGCVEGGYATILGVLEQRLRKLGVTVLCDWPVGTVRRHGSGLFVDGPDAESRRFDRAVLTVPDPHIARMATGMSREERERLAATDYLGVLCVSLLVDRTVTPFYITNITDPKTPFTGIVEMTNLVGREAFQQRSLIYLPLYMRADDPGYGDEDDRVVARFVDFLAQLVPDFSPEQIVSSAVSRARHVLAAPNVGSLDSTTPLHTSVPGLYVVNGAQIVDGTFNVNETIRHAERCVATLLRYPWFGSRRAVRGGLATTPSRDQGRGRGGKSGVRSGTS